MNTTCFLLLAVSLVGGAAPIRADDTEPSSPPRPQSIVEMVDAEIKAAEPTAIGRLANVLLDLERGRIAAWLIATQGHAVVLPFTALQDPPKQGVIELAMTARRELMNLPPVDPRQVDRRDVQAALKILDPTARPEKDSSHDTAWGPLVGITDCIGSNVEDAEGQHVAVVVDVGALSDGTLQYVVLRKHGEPPGADLLAVPLGAFVLSADNQTWSVDLPSELIVKRTPLQYDESTWPSDVDRGWEEYVRVKYGRSLRSVRHLPTR